jgi:hypothetical protein
MNNVNDTNFDRPLDPRIHLRPYEGCRFERIGSADA